ncbi:MULTISPECIES: HAD family hydrolase [unclassified Leeuwenhoekiella]|uniref:KdsC family phosphatase n=1 Tax=unclassified Leeuwenhoekiella TaxID=2615029 RepID=UPI000C684FC1|nr:MULTISPECIES: HAD-IIIA family hydrolase [unclassified Leeuwenhoekiella]MAW95258.1 3-deoxy-D-manno-octulosonate 8-phosphate phosphatase [Leeuwenhoekiella sp.]MBA81819.1 3-deoxy-D-manno-octulosonate 8-phosphate phosphatase [Leeuwenhoekiella sp.]|tara:strand:+ start:1463 stop:1996 length:534 start_codon:yes stop_codon:yes gene_type:complete
MSDKSYKEYLNQITTFIFDVDGVMTDGSLIIDSQGEMLRTMNVKDGYALKTAINKGFNMCIISGGTNEGVRSRLEALGVNDIHLGAHAKIEFLNDYLAKNSIKAENVLYMGDDIPDYPVMQKVGLPCCPQDAVKEIKEVAKYVSHKKGGKGCVRDVIEQVLKVQGKWMQDFDAALKK